MDKANKRLILLVFLVSAQLLVACTSMLNRGPSSLTGDPSCLKRFNTLISTKQKTKLYDGGILTVDEDEIAYAGRLEPDSEQEIFGKMYFDYFPTEGNLFIDKIFVEEAARGKGIQKALYDHILTNFPSAQRITSDLQLTNKEVFLNSLLEELEIDSKSFENIEEYFIDNHYDALKSKDESELNEILYRAVEKTPAYKSRVQYGFKEICKLTFSKSSYKKRVEIMLGMCKE